MTSWQTPSKGRTTGSSTGSPTQSSSRSKSRDLIPIDQVLDGWLKKNKAHARANSQSLFGKWKKVVGEEIAGRTRVIDFKRGELVVEVNSSPLMNELATYYYEDILTSLKAQEEFSALKKIRFRAGAF